MSLSNNLDIVTEAIERPDFTFDSPLVRSVFLRSLIQAHSIQYFDRDIKELGVELPYPRVGTATAVLPDDFRKLKDIYLVDSNENVLIDSFTEGRIHRRPSAAASLLKPNTYITLGDQIKFTWSAADNQAQILATYYALPSILKNETTLEWESDSWILAQYPHLVAFTAAKALAAVTESSAMNQLQALADEDLFALINDVSYIGTDASMRS